jgi:23S rRNA pseudouridine1911/1915/1917 synthase
VSVRKFRTSGADAGQPLGTWLATRLGEPPGAAQARIVAGAIYVDGRRERDPARVLRAAQAIHVQPGADAAEASPAAADAPAWRVVHERDDALVVDKPAGLAVQATRTSAGALDEQVAHAYPGATLVHRIDRDTSGLVLFARTASARTRFHRLLETRALLRDYLAVVYVADAAAPPAATFVLDAPIGPDPRDRRRQAAHAPGGLAARTHASLVRHDVSLHLALLRLRLDSGRTHQIRVHLADAGLPVLGDPLYAPEAVRALAPRLALHATRLAWPPSIDVTSPLPEELARLVPVA